jgi:hypothetical protein
MQQVEQTPAARISQRLENLVDVQTLFRFQLILMSGGSGTFSGVLERLRAGVDYMQVNTCMSSDAGRRRNL